MKLIRRFDLKPSDLPYVESPFFAEGEVRQAISNSLTSHRLVDPNHGSIRLSDGHWGRPQYTSDDLLRDVRDGSILLLKDSFSDRPFSPLVRYDEAEGRWRETAASTFGLSISQQVEQLNQSGLTPANLAGAPAGGMAPGTPPHIPKQTPPHLTPTVSQPLPTSQVNPDTNVQSPASTETLSEPGFHVVQRPMSLNDLKVELYGDLASTPARFEQLNPELLSLLLPGQMIVLGDPNGLECTEEEAGLMDVASQVNRDTSQLSEDEAKFLVENYDLLQFMVSSGAAGMGAGSFAIGQQLNSIKTALEELEELHQRTYTRYGNLSQESFFQQRRAIFQKLDFALGDIARRGMSLDPDVKLKRALGLSSKSIVHHWNTAGVGDIPGYSTHYGRVASAAKWASRVGYVGVGLDLTATVMTINEVCTYGSESECERVKYSESGRFGGGTIGGGVGGAIGVGACAVIGVSTLGAGGLACALILGGAGSIAGGSGGGSLGEYVGDKIYEYVVEQ